MQTWAKKNIMNDASVVVPLDWSVNLFCPAGMEKVHK